MKKTTTIMSCVALSFTVSAVTACNKVKFDSDKKNRAASAPNAAMDATPAGPQPVDEPAPASVPNPAPDPVETGMIPGQSTQLPGKEIILVVTTPTNMIKAGAETLQASAAIKDSSDKPEVIWTLKGPAGLTAIGSIDNKGVYTSPAAAEKEFPLTIIATLVSDPKVTASTVINVIPKETPFASCTVGSKTFPIFAQVYSVPTTTVNLPSNYNDPAQATKSTTVCMDQYAVEPRNFSEGFPQLTNLIEYFSLQTTTTLVIPADGDYAFELNSDDGARLWIDGKEVINNDGNHQAFGEPPYESKEVGKKISNVVLKKGDHPLALNYFQGPKFRIALVLKWKKPGDTVFSYVPRESFK